MKSNTILLLEDDVVFSEEILTFLTKNDFSCFAIHSGLQVNKMFKSRTFDMVILDINVPGLNGLEVCKEIRTVNKNIPILMLTAFGEVKDKVKAFNYGADDYLVKPFHFDELLVRIQALLRRNEPSPKVDKIIKIGRLTINIDALQVFNNGVEVNLSPKEFKLLTILANAKGRILSKNQIAEQLWDYHIETNHNSIEVYINFLRKKLDIDASKKLIHTKIGYGYYLKDE